MLDGVLVYEDASERFFWGIIARGYIKPISFVHSFLYPTSVNVAVIGSYAPHSCVLVRLLACSNATTHTITITARPPPPPPNPYRNFITLPLNAVSIHNLSYCPCNHCIHGPIGPGAPSLSGCCASPL